METQTYVNQLRVYPSCEMHICGDWKCAIAASAPRSHLIGGVSFSCCSHVYFPSSLLLQQAPASLPSPPLTRCVYESLGRWARLHGASGTFAIAVDVRPCLQPTSVPDVCKLRCYLAIFFFFCFCRFRQARKQSERKTSPAAGHLFEVGLFLIANEA